MARVKFSDAAPAAATSGGGAAATSSAVSGSAPAASNSGGWLSSAGRWAGAPFRAAGSLLGNTVQGIGTTAKGLANTAAGGIGTAIGAVGGGLMTAGSYATDAVGLTENAGDRSWAATKAFTGTMADAAGRGLKDTVGGAADLATGGLYDYDGSFFDPKATAVDEMRQQHVQQMSAPNVQEGDLRVLGIVPVSQGTAKNVYGAANTAGDMAAEALAFGAAGKGVQVASRAAGSLPGVARVTQPVVNAAGRVADKAQPVFNTPAGKAVGTAAGVAGSVAGAAMLGEEAIDRTKEIASGDFIESADPLQNFPDADEEQAAQITQAGEQLSALPDSQKQTAATALANPESAEAQELAGKGQQNYIAENMNSAPSDPQQFGGFMNTMLNQFNAMPMEAKIGMGLGLAGGVMSLMQALNGGGIGNFLMAALGIGGAGALAGAGGLLGADAQKFVGDGMLGAAKAFGVEMPEKMDLSALMADDPVAAARAQAGEHGLNWRSSPEAFQAVIDNAEASKAEKLKQLEQLQSVPTWLRPMVLRSIDPDNIKTVEDANRATTNAQQVYSQLSNPESEANRSINEDLDRARYYQGWSRWNPFATEGKKSSRPRLDRALNKYAFNAVDAKEMHDLKNELRKKYDLDNARRHNELSMRQQQAGSSSTTCSPRAMSSRGPMVRRVSITVLRKAARCWAGYEPVPGAKPYSRGSCRPVGSKKTQKEMKKT